MLKYMIISGLDNGEEIEPDFIQYDPLNHYDQDAIDARLECRGDMSRSYENVTRDDAKQFDEDHRVILSGTADDLPPYEGEKKVQFVFTKSFKRKVYVNDVAYIVSQDHVQGTLTIEVANHGYIYVMNDKGEFTKPVWVDSLLIKTIMEKVHIDRFLI